MILTESNTFGYVDVIWNVYTGYKNKPLRFCYIVGEHQLISLKFGIHVAKFTIHTTLYKLP